MFFDIMKKLGARILKGFAHDKNELSSIETELKMEFSDEYRALLSHFGSSIVFDNGATYKPIQLSPVDSKYGNQALEMLYGLSGESNLLEKNKMYQGQIPSELIVIGESVGGNQICLSKKNGKVYFWYHEAITNDESLFEISEDINSFILSLNIDSDDFSSKEKREIDESGSFLDF